MKAINETAGMNEYVVLATRDGKVVEGPTAFPNLQDALQAIAKQYAAAFASPLGSGDPWHLEIVCQRPGTPSRPTRRARRQFFVNARALGAGGDGTEFSPWWGLPEAATELAKLHGDGHLKLEPGQRIRLVHRETFTPTALEKWKKIKESIAKLIFMGMAFALVLPVLAILGFLLVKAWPALSLEFIFQNPKNYMTAGGIWAPLVGTFFLVLFSLLIAAPVGILAGVYLNEYARDNWFTRIINLAVMNLAGVPSIVHALFGVGAFVLFAGMGRSVLAASCTLAVMTLPVIITSTREALASVPMSFREACWNMGATRWQTIRTIVLPNSISGILTGVILQVSRAAGETAPILFTGAVFFVPVADHGWQSFFPYDLGDRCMALSMHLFTLCTQVRGVSEEMQYATAVVLIGLVLVVNSLSIGLRAYLRSRKRW
ncbi:MAG: phosphate ABC transporter permease PstA [Thermoguttaceae bacterium]|jgi:phosphate transport system permease protein